MTRNWGLTSPPAIGGGDRPAGSRTDANTTRANLILFPTCHPFERSEISEPSIDERELASVFLVLGLLSAIGLFLILAYCSLQSFVPQPVEYQVGVKAN